MTLICSLPEHDLIHGLYYFALAGNQVAFERFDSMVDHGREQFVEQSHPIPFLIISDKRQIDQHGAVTADKSCLRAELCLPCADGFAEREISVLRMKGELVSERLRIQDPVKTDACLPVAGREQDPPFGFPEIRRRPVEHGE